MALVDLKRPKPKKSGKGEGAIAQPSYDERPYCLRFTLEGQELEKLGFKSEQFIMKPFIATVEIEPIQIRSIESKTTDEWNKNQNNSVEFQILKIDLSGMGAKPGKFSSYSTQTKKGPGE